MKRCPTCNKTFEDNMRFCQADGTPLVDGEEIIDPYKTMVARPGDVAGAVPPSGEKKEDKGSDSEGDVLELPSEPDANKTQVVSEAEMRAEMAKADRDDSNVVDLPPVGDQAPPEPPKFNEPRVEPPSFGVAGSGGSEQKREEPKPEEPKKDEPEPPSPFSDQLQGDPFAHTTPPIPSPFGDRGGSQPSRPDRPFDEPEAPKFNEGSVNPFEQQGSGSEAKLSQSEWQPPASPEASWQQDAVGSNTPFSPPPAGTQEPSKTLAIVSLVVGILSLFCCGWFVPGIAAVVMGLIARSKANKSPNEYGGGGLVLGGIITGAVSIVLGIIVLILYFFTSALAGLGNLG